MQLFGRGEHEGRDARAGKRGRRRCAELCCHAGMSHGEEPGPMGGATRDPDRARRTSPSDGQIDGSSSLRDEVINRIRISFVAPDGTRVPFRPPPELKDNQIFNSPSEAAG